MPLRSANSTSATAGRRTWNRLRVRLPARLQTHGQSGNAVLLDVSKSGARLMPSFAVRVGQDCVVAWCGTEVFGRIVWERQGHCGVAFDRPITEAVLIATRNMQEREPLNEYADAVREAAQDWASGVGRL